MDVNENEENRCGQCSEVIGCRWKGFVYCAYLHQDVWADSLMCQHGEDLLECF